MPSVTLRRNGTGSFSWPSGGLAASADLDPAGDPESCCLLDAGAAFYDSVTSLRVLTGANKAPVTAQGNTSAEVNLLHVFASLVHHEWLSSQ